MYKEPATDTRPIIQKVPVFRSPPPTVPLPNRGGCKAAACCGTAAYLIIADGHRGVQKVPDLSQVLKPLCLQFYPLSVTLLDRFIDEESEFFDL